MIIDIFESLQEKVMKKHTILLSLYKKEKCIIIFKKSQTKKIDYLKICQHKLIKKESKYFESTLSLKKL